MKSGTIFFFKKASGKSGYVVSSRVNQTFRAASRKVLPLLFFYYEPSVR
jgi:hypothetical protein